jgi:DNA-directed RNA polymerase subunit N (RpoN/RPB10)
MLFYIKCPNCSRILSHNMDKYYAKLKNIREDPEKSKKQKEKESAELLDEFGYYMMCCRNKIIGLIPYHEIIVT